MAIEATAEVIASQGWPQGDIRDPLGTWGFRVNVVGSGNGGGIKVLGQASIAQEAAFVYTVYSLTVALTTGIADTVPVKARILTNWPNIDVQPGIQGYGSVVAGVLRASGAFTSPTTAPTVQLVSGNERFILCYDPRQRDTVMVIVELEIAENVLNDVYNFEGYGYYWDRQVLQAPGGPRHPGSS